MSRYQLAFTVATLIALLSLSVRAQDEVKTRGNRHPQAGTREELIAYLNVVLSREPAKTLALAAQFEKEFPASEFLGPVHGIAMNAYQSLGDYENAVAAGRRALDQNPDDVPALLTLASILPNGNGRTRNSDEILREAENDARHALSVLPALKANRSVPLEEWLKSNARIKATAHEALGQVAFNRRRFAESAAEFLVCTNENPVPDGTQFYRLGLAYFFASQPDEAAAALRRASRLGPDVVRTRAESLLASLHKP